MEIKKRISTKNDITHIISDLIELENYVFSTFNNDKFDNFIEEIINLKEQIEYVKLKFIDNKNGKSNK